MENFKNIFKQKQKGAAMIMSLVFFIAITLSIILGVVAPISNEQSIAKSQINSKQSYFLAESGVEDVLYRIKNGFEVSGSETLVLGEMETTTEVVDLPDNKKSLTSIGDVNNYQRRVGVDLSVGTGATFNYGVQTGNGGFNISGGGNVYGNIYSNGPVVGGGYPIIHGSVVSAGEFTLSPTLSVSGVMPASANINFGYQNTSPQDSAQSFVFTGNSPLKRVRVYMKKSSNNWLSPITMRIVNNSNGSPGKNTIASVELNHSEIPTSFGWVTFTFQNNVNLTNGTTYWIVFDNNGTWSERYSIASGSDLYPSGQAKIGTFNGSWSLTNPSNLDMYFELYPSGASTSLINGVVVGNGSVIGDAYAYEINDTTVNSGLYCQIGFYNNKLCDQSRTNPEPLPMPITEEHFDEWKSQAEDGGVTNGNVTVGWQGATIGPRKIVGNLTVNGGGVLNLTGPLWVTGNITLTGGGQVKSSNTEEKRIIVSDGNISISGGAQATGTVNSYILFATTNTSSNAISLSGGAGTAVLSAPFGTFTATGGANLKAVVAETVNLNGGGSIVYETGLINQVFSGGPSGSWTISGWGEK